MRISIITAVLNREGTVVDMISSLSSQVGIGTDFELEHVIQDGGSTDRTLELLTKYAPSCAWVESKSDLGLYFALNRGIDRSTGDIIGFLHSDDEFACCDVLRKVTNAFSDPHVDGVYGDLDYVSSHDTSRIVRRWRAGVFDQSMLSNGWMPPHPTLFLRRKIYERFGRFDTNLRISADYDFIVRILSSGDLRLTYLPEVLVRMRTGGLSNGSLRQKLLKSREDLRVIRRNNIGGFCTLWSKNVGKLRQFI